MSVIPGMSMASKKSVLSKTEKTFRVKDKFSDTLSKASALSRKKNAEGIFLFLLHFYFVLLLLLLLLLLSNYYEIISTI